MTLQFTLRLLPGTWRIVRLPGDAPWLHEALRSPWAFLARTPDEVSLLLPEEVPAPEGSRTHGPLRGLRVEGTLDFALVGVLAGLSRALAEAGVPILAFSTYDTDYLFVPADRCAEAVRALRGAGYAVEE